MGLGDLIYSVWKPIKNDDSRETSLAINQGIQYNEGRTPRPPMIEQPQHWLGQVQKMGRAEQPQHWLRGRAPVEGFDGMLGPTQANVLNQQDESQYRIMEDKFNTSLSEYARAQQILMDKTQNYIQSSASTNQRNKNIHAIQTQAPDDIHPKWKGCYAGGKGLISQDDMGNSATMSACKIRASDLGYSNFALTKTTGTAPAAGSDKDPQCKAWAARTPSECTANPAYMLSNCADSCAAYITSPPVVAGSKCYVGTFDMQNSTPAYKPVVSYAFKSNKDATMGGLLKNGQIGTFKDYVGAGLVTDLTGVAGCDSQIGGLINTSSTVASYGSNCNVPAPPPSLLVPHFENTGTNMTWNSSAAYAKSKGGRLATFNEVLEYINKQGGGKALVPNQDQWVAVTDGYNGAQRDWEQIGNPGYHFPGKSHVQYYGYPAWGDTLTVAPYNTYVFWMTETVDCSTFGDNDSGLPHACIQDLWNTAGCLTDSDFNEPYWKTNTKKAMISDMYKWATMTDDYHRTKCYGTDKTKWPAAPTPPAPAPKPAPTPTPTPTPTPKPAPTPAPAPAPPPAPANPYHLTQVNNVSWMGSLQYAQSQGGRLPTYAEAIAYIQKVGGALVPDYNQWVAVTNGANNEYDWIAISSAPYPIGSTLVGAGGKTVFEAWFNAPSSNNSVLWVK